MLLDINSDAEDVNGDSSGTLPLEPDVAEVPVQSDQKTGSTSQAQWLTSRTTLFSGAVHGKQTPWIARSEMVGSVPLF